MKEKLLLCLVALLLPITLCYSNPSSTGDGYSVPTDKDVLEKLDSWQDLKFGVIFHWGLYSVPGIIESWALCGEDKK